MAETSSRQLQIDTAGWLSENGPSTVFGLMGVGNLHLILALEDLGIAYVSGRHENGVVAAADGWARVADEVGVATVSRGAGLTNAATALVEARKSATPLVLLVGEESPSVKDTQHLAQEALITSIGIRYVRISSADVSGSLTAIFDHARRARQPLVVELTDASAVPAFAAPPAIPRADDAAISAAASLLAKAERPVVLAGRGAVDANATQALSTLAAQTGAMLTTTAMANGMFVGEPGDLGVCGGFASPEAASVLERADLVVVFGASLNQWTLRHGRLFGDSTPIIRCDASLSVLDDRPATVAILGDAKEVAERLSATVSATRSPRDRWATVPDPAPPRAAAPHRVDAEQVCRELDRLLPRERTLSVDSGHFFGFPVRHITPDGARANVFSQAFLSMGLSIGSGIGAALARPDAVSLVVAGDGGASMSIGELDTASRRGLRLLLCIMNDAAFGMEVHELNRSGLPPESAQFADIDFAAIARGLGAQAITVRSLADLAGVEAWLATSSGPLVLDCKVDPSRVADWYLERSTPDQRAALIALGA